MPLFQIQFQCIFNGFVRNGMEIYHISKSHDENVFGAREIYSEAKAKAKLNISSTIRFLLVLIF